MMRPSQAARGIRLTPLPANTVLCCVIATTRGARIAHARYTANFEIHVGNVRRGAVYRALWLGEVPARFVCTQIVEGMRDHND